MSAEATGFVFRHSPFKGVVFQVHLAIADSVNDQNGNEWFASTATLARKARCTRQTASEALKALEHAGFLQAIDGPTDVDEDGNERAWHRPRRWVFMFVEEAEVVFESRKARAQSRHRRVSAEPTPDEPEEVSATATPTTIEVSGEPTGGVGTADRGVGSCDTEPKLLPIEPKVERARGSQARRPGPPATSQHRQIVDELIAGYRDDFALVHGDEPPPVEFVGRLRSAVAREVRAGRPTDLLATVLGVCARENRTAFAHVLADVQSQLAKCPVPTSVSGDGVPGIELDEVFT